MSAFNQPQYFAISVVPPPKSLEVEYYNTIARTLMITNTSRNQVLIDEVTLRFQSDSGQAAFNPTTDCNCSLDPDSVCEQQVEITPTSLYLENTNVFDVRVKYRVIDGDRIGDQQLEVHLKKSYIIIRQPKTHFGQVFISLKQPEDVHLGHLMAKMARRAGLVPFLKIDNQRLGQDIWTATIEPALASSQACIVIWTDKTNWIAEGVEREISFCRESQPRIPEALFLERGVIVPQLYDGTTIEYTHFDRENPGEVFAAGVETLRRRLQAQGG